MNNVYLSSQSNSAMPKVDYNSNPLKGAAVGETSFKPADFNTEERSNTGGIGQAFYGNGPYSLLHPNNTTEFVAQNCDYIA